MSQAEGGSRLTNSNKSVNGSDAGISDSQDSGDIPEPSEKVADFYEEYSDRADLSLTEREGRALRAEYVEEESEEWVEEQPDIPELEHTNPVRGEQTVRVEALTWGEGVAKTVRNYEETKRTTVNLERGVPSDAEFAEFSVQSRTRWSPTYQKGYFAQIQAWVRELTGGERPSGGETAPTFEDPHVVLLTRSASGVWEDGKAPPVDHAKELQEAWEPCYHTLRNLFRREGYDLGSDWQYERRMEPHKGDRGGGANTCLSHEHTMGVVDGEAEARDFKPVLEKHVDECRGAEMDAHRNRACGEHFEGDHWRDAVGECDDCQTAVVVFEAEELEDIASYVAAYSGVEPTDLLERDVEYVAWAAAMDAGNIRTKSRSEAAKNAATADACKQRYEHPQTNQNHDHGERVTTSARRGCSYECHECGSPHEIDQSPDTLAEANLSAAESGEAVVCDGGGDGKSERRNALRDAWGREQWENAAGQTRTVRGARAAATVGEVPRERSGAERRGEGRELEGVTVRLGGGKEWCVRCHTTDPSGGCEAVSGYRCTFDGEPCSHESGIECECEVLGCEVEEYSAASGYCPGCGREGEPIVERTDEHNVVGGRRDADRTVTTGSDQYRGNSHIPFEYPDPPAHISEPVGFERAPEWHVVSVTVGEEEYPASAGNSIHMVETENMREKRHSRVGFGGLETPEGVVRAVRRDRQMGESGQELECAATGRVFDSTEGYVVVYIEDREVAVRDLAALARWCDGGWIKTGGETEEPGTAEESGLTQEERRAAILEAARGEGVPREELAGEIGADKEMMEHDVEKLLQQGELYDAGMGRLRAT